MLLQVPPESIDKSGLVVHEIFYLIYNDAPPPSREDRGLLNDIYPGIRKLSSHRSVAEVSLMAMTEKL